MKHLAVSLIFILFSSLLWAQTSSTDPTLLTTPPYIKQSMIKCPKIVVNTTTLNSDPTSKILDLGSSCSNVGSGSGGGWAAGVIGSSMIPTCPSSHPYLAGYIESWSGYLLTAGVITVTNVKCCTEIQPPMSFTSGETEWVAATKCP